MDNIYVIRGRIEELYGKHSKLFDKAFQFILAMITFSMINQNTGFMKSLSSPVISLALAVVASASDGDCCDSSGISSCTYAGSVDRNICCIGNDFPDHVYFLYQTGTKDGVCCTSYTDCICSENTISGTCCVCTDIYTGKSGADELRNSCVLYGGIS